MSKLADAVRRCAKYLDALADNMLKNDADMLLDECRDPKDVANELRAALAADGDDELSDILLAASDGWFDDKPHHLFSALGRALQKRGRSGAQMNWMYENIGPLLAKHPLPAPPKEKP